VNADGYRASNVLQYARSPVDAAVAGARHGRRQRAVREHSTALMKKLQDLQKPSTS
jgi:hypothetical protein